MLICWKALSSSTAGTKSQCKHSLAVQVTMDHSLKIIGLAAWERELSELCLSISFLFPFWISSRTVLKPAFLLLAFACVKGKVQAQKHITSFSPHKVFIQMLANLIFPSFSLLTGFQLSFAISPCSCQHRSFVPHVVSPLSVAGWCAAVLSRGAGASESPASRGRGKAVPQFNATLMFTDYQEMLGPAEPLQRGVTHISRVRREPQAPAHIDSEKHPAADVGSLSFWPDWIPLVSGQWDAFETTWFCCITCPPGSPQKMGFDRP